MGKEISGNLNGMGKLKIFFNQAYLQNAQLLCCNEIDLASFRKWTCYKEEATALLLVFFSVCFPFQDLKISTLLKL